MQQTRRRASVCSPGRSNCMWQAIVGITGPPVTRLVYSRIIPSPTSPVLAASRRAGRPASPTWGSATVVTSVNTVGSKKVPPSADRLPPITTLAALPDGIGDMRLDLLDRLHVDQGADHRTGLEPVGDLHRPAVSARRLVKAS